jgi:uncharacterized protein (TIGR03083 family)
MDQLEALRFSVERLRRIVEPLADDAVARPAYPKEWTIAQVMSHLGSSAVIHQRRLEDGLAGLEIPDDFAPSVWDEWNAKSAAAQTRDGLEADAAVLARLESLTPAARETFHMAMGPLAFDFAGFVGLRLNEHVLHTWDIEVALDPTATLPPELAALVVDGLELITRYTAKPTTNQTIVVRTHEPDRTFEVRLSLDGSALGPVPADRPVDLALPAEAFVRLIYGRLDPDHTPPLARDDAGDDSGDDTDGTALATLRASFPGP